MSPFAALAIVFLLLPPQVTQANGVAQGLPFVDVCLGEEDLEAIETALSASGWQESAEQDSALVDGLAWIGVSYYFTGDSGGERLDTVFALKTKSARGLLRKKDIPQSKNRYLTRNSDEGREVLHLMWRKPVPTVLEVECRAALHPESLAPIRTQFETQPSSAFARLETAKTQEGFLDITLLNSAKFKALTPPDAIVTTYRQVRTEKVTP